MTVHPWKWLSLSLACWLLCATNVSEAAELRDTIREAQRKVVKIYGAGGLRQMEAYQSGILISAEGHILTALSYVLDTDDLVAVLDDGRKLRPVLVGGDPVRELAVLRPEEPESGLPYFDLNASVSAHAGQRVLALSNLYGIATGDEPASVLQGVVTAFAPLDARRGSRRTQYRDHVYVLDAQTNNPGAAGGALVDWQGQLVGVLGKELRSRTTGTWLNYALPAKAIAPTVAQLQAGREFDTTGDNQLVPEEPLSAGALGFALVPDVLRRTPPYVDAVRTPSAAATAGLHADDLIVLVDDHPIASCQGLKEVLASFEDDQEVTLSVLRDGALYVLSLQLEAVSNTNAPEPPEAPQP